ncbi:hypothetical protein BX661DRAFT_172019 [Kickxella alabastrina]|uniref:uncharacterized protein n=1 Tax=Kickxella alabastrina TaxID=61397 RepID=UPI00221FD127|nr:uncharacterized protein BX661DRAFT_172019 [Kickxella alabastrina]KAI7825523.1 hypothetical protein BX661DRAFT_172019 [Kickxella alabastrina]
MTRIMSQFVARGCAADNPKGILRLSGWLRGRIERKIRQRIRDELATQQQHKQQQQQQEQEQVAATGVNTILECTMKNCLHTFRADGTKIKDGEKVPSDRRKWNPDMAAALNFRIIINSLLTGERPPCFSCKKASSESAEPESTATLKPKPKPKRVRKNPFPPASSLQKSN